MATTQLRASLPPAPLSKKILAEKPAQFKGEHKEYEQWWKLVELYLQAAQNILSSNEDKMLFIYSLMQEGEVYHFVHYYKKQEWQANIWNWDDFKEKLKKRFLPMDIAKAVYKEL